MKLPMKSTENETFPMAVIVGKKTKLNRLIDTVSSMFGSIRLIESTGFSDFPPHWISPQLVIVTDSYPGGVTLTLLESLKRKLNPRSMICLADGITHENEIAFRSTGLVFLGNYQTFFNSAESIIHRVLSGKN
jgi:hypothetical protein